MIGTTIINPYNRTQINNLTKNLPYCYVLHNVGGGDLTITEQNFHFNTIGYDSHSGWSSTDGQYIVKVAGIYVANWSYYSNSPSATNTRPTVFHQKYDGSTVSDWTQTHGQAAVSVTGIFRCDVGDRIYAGTVSPSFPISIYYAPNHNVFQIACVSLI